MTRIWVVRHGQTMLNAVDRVQGWSDSPLTPLGREQATERGRDFAAAGIVFDAVHCGDGMRHRETAAGILAAAGSPLQPQPDWRWREISFGSMEGALGSELFHLVQAHATAPDPFTAALETLASSDPLAETPATVAERATAALEDAANSGSEVLVVTSGITIMELLRGIGTDLSRVAVGPANLSVTEISRTDAAWLVDRIASTDPVAG
ncbi:histidine phosphatase family protein [Microbacterium sp. 22242]|uniref:histidine phosphatase family protein n=1 Tax=Microbacterium sp. 22242 TaxID=3453896 RepID=UPI003F831731